MYEHNIRRIDTESHDQEQENANGDLEIILDKDKAKNNFETTGEGENLYMSLNENMFDTITLNEKTRIPFARKVFMLVGTQLFITILFVVMVMYTEAILEFQKSSASKWTMIVAIIIFFVLFYTLYCNQKIARMVPYNYIQLFTLTIAQGWTLSFSCTKIDPVNVLMAFVQTLSLVIGLIIYSFYTTTDFSKYKAFGFAIGCCIVMFGLLQIFFYDYILNCIVCCIIACILSVYIIIDVQMIIGKRSHKYLIDDYIIATLSLYLDIINIFVEIVAMFRGQ